MASHASRHRNVRRRGICDPFLVLGSQKLRSRPLGARSIAQFRCWPRGALRAVPGDAPSPPSCPSAFDPSARRCRTARTQRVRPPSTSGGRVVDWLSEARCQAIAACLMNIRAVGGPVAPSAMRMPTSRTRDATPKANTPKTPRADKKSAAMANADTTSAIKERTHQSPKRHQARRAENDANHNRANCAMATRIAAAAMLLARSVGATQVGFLALLAKGSESERNGFVPVRRRGYCNGTGSPPLRKSISYILVASETNRAPMRSV